MRKIPCLKIALALFAMVTVTSMLLPVTAQFGDVAVDKITVKPANIPRGKPVYINVTVKNEGSLVESFTVYVYADGLHPPFGDEAVLPPQTVLLLAPGESKTLYFTWDTAGIPLGAYTISAYIPAAAGETDTADNFLKGPIVGGIFEPSSITRWKLGLGSYVALAISMVLTGGIAAIGVFKMLMIEKPLRLLRLFAKTLAKKINKINIFR